MPTLVFVPINWPQDEFVAHIEALRLRQGIKDIAEMMRAAGLDPSLHTNWRKGKRPTMGTLDKLAPVLGTSPTALYLKAGHLKQGDLEARSEMDLAVLPTEILELIKLYQSMTTDSGRRQVREWIDFAVGGLRAKLAEPKELPQASRKRAS